MRELGDGLTKSNVLVGPRRNRLPSIDSLSPAAWWRMDDPSHMATATDGTGAVSDGSAVAYVEDLSGNARHLTQGSAAARGSFDASAGRVLMANGDWMTAPADILVAEGFIVISDAALQSGVCALFSETAAARWFIHLSSSEIVSLDGSSTATRGAVAVGSGAYTPSDLTGSNVTLPGANLLGNPTPQVLSFVLAVPNYIRQVGRLYVSATEFTGPKSISEVVLYAARLTNKQRAGVLAELADRRRSS